MEWEKIRYWIMFIAIIVIAVLVSDWIAAVVVTLAGFGGVVRFIANFIVFALAFFGIVAAAGRLTGMNIFGYAR